MKKLRYLYALLLCILSVLSTSVAENSAVVLFDEESESLVSSPNQIISTSNSLLVLGWWNESQCIWEYAGNSNKIKIIYVGQNIPSNTRETTRNNGEENNWYSEFIDAIAYGENGNIYAISVMSRRIGIINDMKIDWLNFELPLPSYDEYNTYNNQWYKMLGSYVGGGELRILITGPDNNSWLYCANLVTGEAKMPSKIDGAYAMVQYRENSVIIAKEGKNENSDICYYDLVTGSEEILYSTTSYNMERIAGLAYDSGRDAIFFVENGRLQRLSKKNAITTMAYISASVEDISSAALINDTYVLCSNDIKTYDVSGDLPLASSLEVMGYWSSKAAQNYGNQVLVLDNDSKSIAAIVEDIRSGKATPDVYEIASTQNGYLAMKNKGFLSKLEKSFTLTNFVSTMYPQIIESLQDSDGDIVAVPVNAAIGNIWSIDRSLWDRYYPNQDPPKTWCDFLRLMLEWENKYGDDEPCTFFKGHYIKRELVMAAWREFILLSLRDGKEVNFQDEVFRATLLQIESLPFASVNPGSLSEMERDEMDVYANKRSIFTPSAVNIWGDQNLPLFIEDDVTGQVEERHIEYIPVPLFSEDQKPVYTVEATLAFINPNSMLKDEANDFLIHLLDNLTNDARYLIDSSLTEPIRDNDYASSIKEMEQQLLQYEEIAKTAAPIDQQSIQENIKWLQASIDIKTEFGQWVISPNSIEFYKQKIAPYLFAKEVLYFDMNDENSPGNAMRDLLQRYSSGQMTLDELLIEMNHKAIAIRREAID